MKLKGFKMLACLGGLGLMMTQTAQAQAFDYKQYAQPQVVGQQTDSKLEEVSGLALQGLIPTPDAESVHQCGGCRWCV